MKRPIERIFGSRIRANLLGWLYSHTDEDFFVRQLATLLKEDSTNLSRELSNLENVGILVSSRKGNLKYFSANKNCSFFNELRGFILKTIGIAGELKSALEKKLPDIKYAFIYGSFAKGEETADSDVDLMIIGEVDLNKLDPLISNIEKKLGRTVNYTNYNIIEFRNRKKAGDGFVMDVLKDNMVMLVGDENGLKKA